MWTSDANEASGRQGSPLLVLFLFVHHANDAMYLARGRDSVAQALHSSLKATAERRILLPIKVKHPSR